jgi:hypothetical protein
MNLQLRPSTLGEILDRTASLYRSRFLVFVGIASVPAGVVLGFVAAFCLVVAWTGAVHPASLVGPWLLMGAIVLTGLPACLIVTALALAAISHAASLALLGDKPAIIAAYKAAWNRGGRYIGLLVLQTLILAVAPLVVWTVVVALIATLTILAKQSAAGIAPSAFMVLLFLTLATYFVWMLLRLCLAFPVAVVEGTSAWAALKRASTLSKGTRGRILLLYLLCAVIGWVVSLLITVPVTMAFALFPGMSTPQHEQTLGTVFLISFYGASFAVQALTKPVYGIALILFYYDQRIRKEGFDIEFLMRQAGMMPDPTTQPAPAPWMPPLIPERVPLAPERTSQQSMIAQSDTPGPLIAQPSVSALPPSEEPAGGPA